MTSDLVFLLELVVVVSAGNDEIENKSNSRRLFTVLSRFVHDVCHRVPLQLNSCSWSLLLRSLGNMLDILIPTTSTSATASHSCIECLSTLKLVLKHTLTRSLSLLLLQFLSRIKLTQYAFYLFCVFLLQMRCEWLSEEKLAFGWHPTCRIPAPSHFQGSFPLDLLSVPVFVGNSDHLPYPTLPNHLQTRIAALSFSTLDIYCRGRSLIDHIDDGNLYTNFIHLQCLIFSVAFFYFDFRCLGKWWMC